MPAKPPTYEEVTDGPPGPLVVRLQVWHFARGGKSPAYNRKLADSFALCNMQDWAARPADDAEPDTSYRDDFAPVEVDFENLHPNASRALLETQVRDLFVRIAPFHVYVCFLSIRICPHIMNIRPIGMAETNRARYTHAFVLNCLDVRARELPLPAGASAEQDELLSLLRTGELALYTLGAVVNTYTLTAQIHSQDQTWPAALQGLTRAEVFQEHVLSRNTLPRHLQTLQDSLQKMPLFSVDTLSRPASTFSVSVSYGTFTSRMNKPDRALRSAWANLSGPLERYRSLADRKMHRVVDKLYQKQRMSNQELYELVLDMRTIALRLPDVQSATIQLLDILLGKYIMCAMISLVCVIVVAIGLLVLFIVWVASPQNVAAAVGTSVMLGGGTLAAILLGVRYWFLACKNKVRHVKSAVECSSRCLNDARAAVAAVFCGEVLKFPLSTIGEHEKRSMLGNLGIDIDALVDWDFQPELLLESIKRFRNFSTDLNRELDEVISPIKRRFSNETGALV
ncbi:hypothetical protein MFIFM68171_03003 [Madurella fahalii]|uniref:Uncharacterized protein n=1 Tax=Madurella fahalii TaxID=1157608 RepID=A0ABQ0G4X6_9PEZI